MPRQLFTADDIRRLARERSNTLVLGQGDIITHEANDVAYALGVKIVRSAESGSSLRKEPLPVIPALPPLFVAHSLMSVQERPVPVKPLFCSKRRMSYW